MIINGGSRANFRFFARHLMKPENERVEIREIRGLMSGDVLEALREMDAIASGTRTVNFMYHANLNPSQDEQLTAAQWQEAVDRLERSLGLEGHARIVVEHEKKGRVHQHVIWNRIDPDTMTAVSDSYDYRKHQATSREIEAAFGLAPIESVTVKGRDTERPERRPKDWETFRARDTAIDPHAMKAEITALWQAADSALSFKAALEDAGYILAKGDRRDFCIIDAAGDEHSLARRISGVKAADLRARMAEIDPSALPSVAEARALAHVAADTASSGGSVEPHHGPDTTDALAREFSARFEGWKPLTPQSEAAGGAELERSTSAGTSEAHHGWRHFADRVKAFQAQASAYLLDETSGTPQEGRSVMQRFITAGRELWKAKSHRDGAALLDGIEEASGAIHDLVKGEGNSSPSSDAKPASWRERLLAEARHLLHSERGSVPADEFFSRMAEEWAASAGGAEETSQSPETSDMPDVPTPATDGWDIEP